MSSHRLDSERLEVLSVDCYGTLIDSGSLGVATLAGVLLDGRA